MAKTRTEKDALGTKKVPLSALYGIQTQRAHENFQISGLAIHPAFIVASAQVKGAAALANMKAGTLNKKIGKAIVTAAHEIVAGKWHDQFIVDVFQAGAGTSHHMNVNEVIANRASKICKKKVDAHDHVNMCQSTNDFYPTAMRIAAYQQLGPLLGSLKVLAKTFDQKSNQFRRVRKSGRTHLQDAVPMTLGQEFGGYAACLEHHIEDVTEARKELTEVGLGGTAVGTGLNATLAYRRAVIGFLKQITGVPVKTAEDMFFAMWGMTHFVHVSGALRSLAVDLTKISNDLRLLSSGPHTGLYEINLPAVQPGSSIMPGKVNPSIVECLNMICCQVVGNDTAIAMASSLGQLELNVMMPIINFDLLNTTHILTNGMTMFAEKCVRGITANTDIANHYANATAGLATVLNPIIGYDNAAELAKESLETGVPIKHLVIERGLMSETEWSQLIK